MEQRQQLISVETNAAVRAAFDTLAKTAFPHAQSLEDLVREMLQPILKSWIDDNLPAIVERLVRAEIEQAAQ
jgi:cell pole-organizing protein PopZ